VGFGYFFPALARLALSDPDSTQGWYGPQLLFHLTYEEEANRHLRAFEPDQRCAVVALLRHLAATRSQLAHMWVCDDDLRRAISLWSGSEADG
jgi:hypothetical protein